MMVWLRAIALITALLFMGVGAAIAAQPTSVTSESVEHIVEITGFKFIPESLSVKAGDTVTWINKDIAPHTATADDNAFDTGELKLNESRSIKVSEGQAVRYFCKFHPMMKADLTFE